MAHRQGGAWIFPLILLLVSTATAGEFFPLGRRHPVQGVFLSPPLTDAAVLPAGGWRLGWRFEESNTLNRGATSSGTQVLLDTESSRLALDLGWGLGGGWELRAELPWHWRWGGVLDRPIEAVERVFSQLNPLRGRVPRNASRLYLLADHALVIDQRGAVSGWGDVELGLVRGVVLASGLQVAGEWRLALPTGDEKTWLGSGGVDLALVLRAGKGDGGRGWVAQVAWVDPADPFETLPGGLSSRRHLEVSGGVRGRLGTLGGQVQLAWRQSAIAGSGLAEFEEDLWEVAAGLEWRLKPGLTWQVGLIENLVVAPGADVTVYSRFVLRP
ncbi:MAG: DUF3187 family protein [Acidobacteriota bacterium]|nr:DUF3187 family protein [Acidobacteriota bacterium]MDQ7088720.1 DUF3187 family protein [Acidobacteriota bacterium]